jgi:hypothetical protein
MAQINACEINTINLNELYVSELDRLCGLIEFLDANPEVPGSIPGATRFSE